MWVCVGHGGAEGFMVGHDDLEGHFQPLQLCDSSMICSGKYIYGTKMVMT